MQIRYPEYYQMFQCIASACPDSCCKEWEVDVDNVAAAYYRTLTGDLGDRLRQVLKDTDDGTVMTIENGIQNRFASFLDAQNQHQTQNHLQTD